MIAAIILLVSTLAVILTFIVGGLKLYDLRLSREKQEYFNMIGYFDVDEKMSDMATSHRIDRILSLHGFHQVSPTKWQKP